MDECVYRKCCEFLKEENKVVFILMFVEKVGMLIGIVSIVCVIYVIFVSVYVYIVDCDWECDKDIRDKVLDDGFKC